MNGLVKFILFLNCFNHQLLITACEEQLIYGVSDWNTTKLFSIPLNGTEKPAGNSTLLFNFENGKKISSLECTGKEYFISTNSPPQSSNIYRLSLKGLQTFGVTLPYPNVKLRQDWLTGKLYLMCGTKIMVGILEENSNMTTLTTRVILDIKTDRFFDADNRDTNLALNPNAGLMYFSIENKIMQANMDGSGSKEFVSNISRVVAIALDLTSEGEERLYWMGYSSIEFIKLDGSGRGVVGHKKSFYSHSFNSPTIHMDQLIYIDNVIKSINKYNGSEVWEWGKREWQWNFEFVLTICDERNRPIRRNPCGDAKCSYLCLLSAGSNSGFECLCPEGKFLDLDGFTCIDSSLAIAEGNVIKLIRLNLIGMGKFETITLGKIKSIRAFCYNPKTHAFILYDSVLNMIFEYNLITKRTDLLVSSQIGNVETLGIDAFSQNLYWIDSQRQILEIMSLDTRARKVLRSHVVKYNKAEIFLFMKPTTVILATGKDSLMFYSLDGSTSKIISGAGNVPIGLSYESKSKEIFWLGFCTK